MTFVEELSITKNLPTPMFNNGHGNLVKNEVPQDCETAVLQCHKNALITTDLRAAVACTVRSTNLTLTGCLLSILAAACLWHELQITARHSNQSREAD